VVGGCLVGLEIELFQKSPRKISVLLRIQSFLCAKHVFYLNKSYFYSRSFQKYSRTSVENSRTFQGYPTISQFSRTLRRPVQTCLYPRHNLTPARTSVKQHQDSCSGQKLSETQKITTCVLNFPLT